MRARTSGGGCPTRGGARSGALAPGRGPLPGPLARAPCPGPLPGHLARAPCPGTLPGDRGSPARPHAERFRSMTTTGMPLPDVAVTQRLLGMARARGSHQALAGRENRAYSYSELAAVIQAAAAGLAWRGLHPRDVVGVHVPDAVCYALAAHAIRAAGGVPSPVAAGLTAPEIAGQLAVCGAPMLLI